MIKDANGRLSLYKASFEDCLAKAEGQADLVLMSPPYCDARNYGAGVSWQFEDYQRLGDAVARALKPGGHSICVVDAPVRVWRKGFDTERGFMPWKVMIDWAERVGLRCPDRLAYGRMGAPGGYFGRFRNDWEPILWHVKLGAKPFFDKKPLAEDAKYPFKGKLSGSRNVDGVMQLRNFSGWAAEEGKKHRGTYWDYGTMGYGHDDMHGHEANHPAPYALKFAEDAVRCFAPQDGLVVDPFLGSGTTAVAALRHGRRFIGGDLFSRNDGVDWIEITAERLRKHSLL